MSFIFTSIGIGLSLLINSFYLIKIKNENNLIKNKLNLLLNEQKLIIEGNISIYEFITKNINAIKTTNLIINDKVLSLRGGHQHEARVPGQEGLHRDHLQKHYK